MKYSVETTNNGYIETLEIRGKTYHREYRKEEQGIWKSEQEDFCDQMAADGFDGYDLQEEIYDLFDGEMKGMDMCKLAEEYGLG